MIFGLVIIIGLTWIIMSTVFLHGYNSQMSKLRSGGRYSSLADFQPPNVPPDQNAATIYTDMINRNVDRELSEDWRKLRSILYATRNGKNREQWKEARLIVNKHKKICDQIEKASKRPYCVFPMNWSENPPKDLFKYSHLLQYASIFYQAEAILDAKDGKSVNLEPIYTCITLGESFSDKPDDILQMIRQMILNSYCDTLLRILDYQEMSNHDLRSLYNILSDIDLADGLKLSMKRNLLMGLVLPSAVVSPEILPNAPDTGFMNAIKGSTESAFDVYYENIGQYGDKSVWVSYIDKLIQGMDLSYYEAQKQNLLERPIPFYAVMTYQLGTVYGRYNSIRYYFESKLTSTRIALALHAYQNLYGSYPSSIGELRSKLGWEIPKDTFSDRDFIYRKTGNGFLLYSIGFDQKDDGGVDMDTKPRNSSGNRTGDIVFESQRQGSGI